MPGLSVVCLQNVLGFYFELYMFLILLQEGFKKMKLKRIGVLTSGGDSPGMNAVVSAVVSCAAKNGLETIGICRGYSGLMNNELKPLSVSDVSGISGLGGTVLFSARCLEMKTEQGRLKAVEACKKNGIDGLVVVGGDGTFCGAQLMSKAGIPCIGLPGTIDNDLAYTEYTLGYDTAVNTAIQMVDRLDSTTKSHDRCSVVEVMGRHAGYIALAVGLSCSASFVVVPEVEFNKQSLFDKLKRQLNSGKKYFIVVVSECILNVAELAKEIEDQTKIETRATVLGHVQRGGSPTARDRILGVQMGCYAVRLLSEGISNRVVGLKNGKLVDYEINEALAMKKEFPVDLHEMVSMLF